MSLVPAYDDSSHSSLPTSSESSSDSDDEVVSQTEDIGISPKMKFPAPDFLDVVKNGSITKNSVFKNPFVEAETQKEAILQKHVKMVEAKDSVVIINGKKICWNYRKGRCRFGHNCKFAHDSDIQYTKENVNVEKLPIVSPQNVQHDVSAEPTESSSNNQKRKRPGLVQGLIPGKKVMKNYRKFKD